MHAIQLEVGEYEDVRRYGEQVIACLSDQGRLADWLGNR